MSPNRSSRRGLAWATLALLLAAGCSSPDQAKTEAVGVNRPANESVSDSTVPAMDPARLAADIVTQIEHYRGRLSAALEGDNLPEARSNAVALRELVMGLDQRGPGELPPGEARRLTEVTAQIDGSARTLEEAAAASNKAEAARAYEQLRKDLSELRSFHFSSSTGAH